MQQLFTVRFVLFVSFCSKFLSEKQDSERLQYKGREGESNKMDDAPFLADFAIFSDESPLKTPGGKQKNQMLLA